MRPCQHNVKTKTDLWHYPKGSPALELARLCPDCVAREQRAGVEFFTAGGARILPFAPAASQPPMETPVPRSKPVEIICADCGKTARLKAHGRCSRCYDIDRQQKAAAAIAFAAAAKKPEAPAPAPSINVMVGVPAPPSVGERALAGLLLVSCDALGSIGNMPRLRAVLEAVLDGRPGVLGTPGGAP